MGFDSPTHWLLLLVVAGCLFGYKKLPDVARSVGQSLRAFSGEMKRPDDKPGVPVEQATADLAR